MKKVILMQLVLILVTGCQALSEGIVQPIALPNGNHGYIVDCSGRGMTACFKSAGDKCVNGYSIHERTTNVNTDSKIQIDELGIKRAVQAETSHYSEKDLYMVISCKP